MRIASLAPLLLALACAHASTSGRREKRSTSTILLNGTETDVRWSDGDSFSLRSGPYAKKGTRLRGYNTLESYGAVHRWGEWTPAELYEIAKRAGDVGASRTWECTTDGKEDGYRRILVDCPALTEEMVRTGIGFVYEVEQAASPALLALQQQAKAERVGIWKKGTPAGIVSSLHSADEGGGEGEPYNRVVDTRTGAALPRPHQNRYETCQEVCEVTDGDRSCLIYVPFKERYRNPPSCIKAH